MKSATVADLRNQFATVSKWIQDGETVTITKRGLPFAKLSPAGGVRGRKSEATWPERSRWRERIFPDGPVHGDAQDVIDYDRGDT